MRWKTLGSVEPQMLDSARLELHHALQLIAVGAARSLLPPAKDDSHTNLGWDSQVGAWISREIPDGSGIRTAIRAADLTLRVTRNGASEVLPLEGRNLEAALDWLRRTLEEMGVDPSGISLESHFEIPDHPVAHGRAFSGEPRRAFEEMARYYSNADELFRRIAREAPSASPIRTWPHHFDHATLLSFDPDTTDTPRTIGVGFSPGDESYREPYLYVSPYPHPHTQDWPPLQGGGHWHTEGFVGAVLPASRFTSEGEKQKDLARAFVVSAIAAGRALLGLTPPS